MAKNIRTFVERWIKSKISNDTQVLDLPCGNGQSSKLLGEQGAQVTACDLFPQFFKYPEINFVCADISKKLPFADSSFSHVLCQEGLEHFSDQLHTLKEFSRVLKEGGSLLLTTPNASNLRSKFSFLFGESERIGRYLGVNEIDSLWYAQEGDISKIYFGHVFLISIAKLRLLALAAGLEISEIHQTAIKPSSVVLFVFLYPFILAFNFYCFIRSSFLKKHFKTYWKVFKLLIHPGILTMSHLMVEFKKTGSNSFFHQQVDASKKITEFIT